MNFRHFFSTFLTIAFKLGPFVMNGDSQYSFTTIKGKLDDCNNYRATSLLSLLQKNFETLLAEQVCFHFE